ncbi:hypothetical protein OG786_13075 [Streptomyces sp. NBC_00101]|uniref:hypothetical protein n=1 Tax=Streptomyces sp. NBC_00101 TaxID=2975651 RepID=UPI00324611AD
MSEPSSPPAPPDPGGGGPLEAWGQILTAASEVLSTIGESLKTAPILLAGYATMLLATVASALSDAPFLPVVLVLCGIYTFAVLAHFAFRRWGSARSRSEVATADGARARARVRRSRRVHVPRFEEYRGNRRVDVDRSEDVFIGGSPAWESAPAAPPVPQPPPVPDPSPGTGPAEPRRPGARTPYTPTLARNRDTVLNAARGGARGDGVRFEIVADSGCGKTLLLDEVAAGLKEDGRLVLFITAGAPQYGEGGEVTGAGREMAEYAACRQIIDAIAADVRRAYAGEDGTAPLLDPTVGREWEAAVLATRDGRRQEPSTAPARPTHVTIDVSHSSDVRVGALGESVAGALPGALSQAPAPSRLDEMQLRLTGVLDRLARDRPTALLVDDVHTVAGTPVEAWLMNVVRGMSTAVVVHAGRPASGGAESVPGVRRLRLGLLSRQETTTYLRERLTDADWRRAEATSAADEIATLTRGHPIGVATCAAIVRDSLPANAAVAEVRSLLLGGAGHWDDDGAFEAVRTYVDDYAARVVGRPLALFDLLVVVRRCTPTILAAVLHATEGVPEAQGFELYDWLTRRAFVTPFDDDENEGWRLHDYLRENLDRRFRLDRPAAHADLHAAVERHYRATMNFDEERQDQTVMALGSRYEYADWQRDSQEWLYHAAYVPRAAFEGSKRAMIRLFLEAFYWWGMEAPSSYCDQLVSSYRALPADRDLRWVTWLDDLRTGYVAGRVNQVPGRDRERWERAGAALDSVADYLRLRRGHVPADPDLRRIYIVHSQLQAETIWFASDGTDADRDRAEVWFRASRDACTGEKELWMRNWADLHIAMLRATSDPAHARILLDGLEDRVAAEDDHELPVWLAETFADIAWAENDHRRSFDARIRAVLHGFVYHVRQDDGQFPSSYTDSLYRSVLTHMEEREREALDAGLTEEVAAAKARSRALFAPYWRHLGQDPGDTFGLPHPAAPQDLGTDQTDFFRTAKWVIRTMGDELDKSVEEPVREPAV